MARRNVFERILDDVSDFAARQVARIQDTLFGRGEAEEPLPPEPQPEETDETSEAQIIEEAIEEFEELEDEEFYEDDFESYLAELREAAEEAERTSELITLRQFLSGGGDIKRVRKVRYASEEDALDFLTSTGLGRFAEIFIDEDSDTFGLVVYDSPGATPS